MLTASATCCLHILHEKCKLILTFNILVYYYLYIRNLAYETFHSHLVSQSLTARTYINIYIISDLSPKFPMVFIGDNFVWRGKTNKPELLISTHPFINNITAPVYLRYVSNVCIYKLYIIITGNGSSLHTSWIYFFLPVQKIWKIIVL